MEEEVTQETGEETGPEGEKVQERETDQEEYDRKQKEKADAIRERQIRLGDIPAPVEEGEEESEPEKSE